MAHNNGQHPIEDDGNETGLAGNVQAPSTLLPLVLSRLGLENGNLPPFKPLNDPQAALRDENWQIRVAAVRRLGQAGMKAPLEPLLAALHDEDASVRAAAVHALGTMGERAAVDQLIAALRDDDWHVRETAALALGKLGQHVPFETLIEPLTRALQDTDGAVREAAQMALQWRRQDDVSGSKDPMFRVPWVGGMAKPAAQNAPFQQKSTSTRRTGMQEQEYENQEQEYYRHRDETTSRWDKVTSYTPPARSRSPWRIGIASMIFFTVVVAGAFGLGVYVYGTNIHSISVGKPTFINSKSAATPLPNPGTIYTFTGHQDTVNAVQWSPNGTRIASASDDKTVQVWDAFTGSNVLVYGGHAAPVRTVAWSPDGTRIASGSTDGTIEVWNPVNGDAMLTYHFQNSTADMPHIGAMQAASGGGSQGTFSVAWSPDGQRLAATMAGNSIQIFDASTGQNIFTYRGFSDKVNAMSWSPNGKYIVAAGAANTTTVFDAANGQNVFTFPIPDQDAEDSLAWSPDSSKIAIGNVGGTVRVWNPLSNSILVYKGHSMNVFALAWSPDGTRIASGSIDDTVQIWDASTMQHLYTYEGHTNEVRTVAWAPNGKLLASGSSDRTVQVWPAA